MREKTCLIIAPFDVGASRIVETVKRAIYETGILPVTISRSNIVGGLVSETILDELTRADLIVFDVSRQNPNVMYELGFAHALRKPTILIINREVSSRIPSILEGHIYIAYDESNLTSLRENIVRFASQIINTRSEGSLS